MEDKIKIEYEIISCSLEVVHLCVCVCVPACNWKALSEIL
jgi:hypothetical protein